MALELPYGVKLTNPKPVDFYYSNDGTPYTSESEANSAVPSGVRYLGLTVNINNQEWWYKDGLTDVDLVVKASSSRYVHSQPIASATWTIDHNLGVEPNITVYDDSTPPQKLIAPIEHNSVNQAVVNMQISVSGKAICLA